MTTIVLVGAVGKKLHHRRPGWQSDRLSRCGFCRFKEARRHSRNLQEIKWITAK
jgi:hypothetical protein